MHIRPENPDDLAAVHAVNEAAFETSAEADLVDAMRGNAEPLISLVAEVAGSVVGHILFSPMTLATMVEEVNRVRKAKIITIEDPIEFVFTHDKSIITQREIATDTEGFPNALHAALRQDPDVIMVGEMRDHETVDTSLKAAETGHMVFSSIHTSDVSSTINRLVSFFPSDEQSQVRSRIADNIRAVVSLRLLPNKKQTGRVPAVEIMRSTRSIQECIKDPSRTHEIKDFISKGRAENMQTFDQHLLDLLRANKISVETALSAASNPTDFRTKLALEGGDPDASETVEKVTGPMELESDERF